jgi:hypothetical protein
MVTTPLGRIDQLRHGVQHGRLARAGTARDHHVQPVGRSDLEHLTEILGHVALAHHDVERDGLLRELADGDRAAVDRQRRRDDVDARAVGQTGIGDRAGLVDAAADPGHDALRDVHHMRIVAEADLGQLQLTLALDVDLLRAVDHDVVDRLVRKQRLERPEPDHVVDQGDGQLLLLATGHRQLLFGDDLRDQLGDLALQLLARQLGGGAGVDALEQSHLDAQEHRLGLRSALFVGAGVDRGGGGGACGAGLAGEGLPSS